MSGGGICIQCALREFVGLLEQGKDPLMNTEGGTGGRFEGDPMEHMKAEHPNPVECQRERADLERRAALGYEQLKASRRGKAKNAQNN